MSRMTRRRALLIGNQTYDDVNFDDLPSVRADLAFVKQVLEDRRIGGFTEVRPLLDLTANQMREAIYDFLEGSRQDELAVLYFSGHGTRTIDTNGEFHFIATDTDARRLEHTAVRAHYVNDQLEQCTAAQRSSSSIAASAAVSQRDYAPPIPRRRGRRVVVIQSDRSPHWKAAVSMWFRHHERASARSPATTSRIPPYSPMCSSKRYAPVRRPAAGPTFR